MPQTWVIIALMRLDFLSAKRGNVFDFIENNKIGYSIEPENIKIKLLEIYSDFKNQKLIYNPEFNVDQYDIKNIALEIEKILI